MLIFIRPKCRKYIKLAIFASFAMVFGINPRYYSEKVLTRIKIWITGKNLKKSLYQIEKASILM